MTGQGAAQNRFWDAIVIGAGPAGSMSAYLLAKKGHSVLLVDKSNFPRHKVCGCCLNEVTQNLLQQNGLGSLLEELGAVSLNQFSLHTKRDSVHIALENAKAVSRERFDFELINRAIDAGACFLAKIQATIESIEADSCAVSLKDSDSELLINCKVVIVADGIAGRALDKFAQFSLQIVKNSRIGAGTLITDSNPFYKQGNIYMSTAPGGYVGLVRLEDNRLDIAAAFDLDFIRKAGGPSFAAARIMGEAGLPQVDGILESDWHGTVALSRSRKTVGEKGIFVIGDSSSYAEPLTGEGIAWALLSACAVVPIVSQAILHPSPKLSRAWNKEHRRLIRTRQENSFRIAKALRNSTVTSIVIELLNRFPSIARSIVRYTGSIKTHPIEVS